MTEIEQLYDEYFSRVYGYAVSLCKNKAAAEDITSETFLRAIKNYRKIDTDKNVNSWLCQIAKNIYLDSLRRKGSSAAIDDIPEISDGSDILSDFTDRESAKEIFAALHRLDEPYKEVFSLRVLGELSFGDIGAIFDKSENWARVTFFRAKKKIHNILKETNGYE